MGWFWSSTAPPAPPAPATTAAAPQAASPPPQPDTLPTSSLPPPPRPNPGTVADDDPENDPELVKFVAMLKNGAYDEDLEPKKAAAVATKEAKQQVSRLATWKAAWSSKSPGEDLDAPSRRDEPLVTRERSLAEATLPVTMSCRQSFDLAWDCQSPAGQWRAIYRNGSVRQCSDWFDDFWFCMRVKGYAEGPMKEEAIRSYHRKKEIDKYYLPGKPSSEDVWTSRTVDEVLPPSAVFQQSFHTVLGGDRNKPADAEASGRQDASNIVADAERRNRIRQDLGYNK